MTAARDAWTRPGTYEVAPGVHRIVCPLPQDGLQAVNVYAIEDGAGVALVDTGWNHPDIVAALEGGLASLGSSLEAVTAIICTHSHYDHYGLAGQHPRALRRAGDARAVRARKPGDRARPRALRPRRRGGRRRMVLHGAPAPPERPAALRAVAARGPWEPPDRVLEDGEPIELDRARARGPAHPRSHARAPDVRRRRADLRRRPSAAAHHAVAGLRVAQRRPRARALPGLAGGLPRPGGPGAAGPRTGLQRPARARRGARGAPPGAAAGLRRRARGARPGAGGGRRRPPDLDAARAQLRLAQRLQPDAGRDRDDHAPAVARGSRPDRAARRRAAALQNDRGRPSTCWPT